MKALILTCILVPSCCWSRNDSSNAVRHLQRAILKNTEVKRVLKDAQNFITNTLDIDLQDAKYLAPAVAIIAGKLDSSSFGPVKLKAYEGVFTPRVLYKFQGQSEIQMGVFFNKDF